MWNIDSDERYFLSPPAADSVNRHIPSESYNQTTFATPGIRILLKYLPAQQSFFDLSKGQLIRPALNLSVMSLRILVSENLALDLFRVHSSTANLSQMHD